MNSIDDGLRALLTRGFRFRRHTDAHGEIVSVVGTYQWSEFCDRLYLYGEDSALATRIVRTSPGTAVWSHRGDALSTMAALLRLPGPHDPGAPSQVRRAPRGIGPPE